MITLPPQPMPRSPKTPYTIVVLPGDGIGHEVTDSALTALSAGADRFGVRLDYEVYQAGAQTYLDTGLAISEETMAAVGRADAVLLGAMGLPAVRKPDGTEITPRSTSASAISSLPAFARPCCCQAYHPYCMQPILTL